MGIDGRLIVVTGGAGFIGSGVVKTLNERYHTDQIVIVDDLGSSEKWKNLVGKRFVDIIPKEMLWEWLIGREQLIGGFVHLGACADTLECNASYLLENNYRYSVRLAEYALRHGHRLIYASSAATYGDGAQGFIDQEAQLDTLRPLNMYAFSKHLFDLWARREGVLNQLVGLKYFNVFGPNEGHKGRMASAITRMVPRILTGEAVQLFRSTDPARFADGEQTRDFIYVKDAARMTCAFLENQATGLYNIGMGHASTWNELASAVYRALGHSPHIEYIDMPAALRSRYQQTSCAEMTRTRCVLGDRATCMPLEEAVIDYVRHYLLPGMLW